jgi:WhiB family redox-sensing transcriptional regulator
VEVGVGEGRTVSESTRTRTWNGGSWRDQASCIGVDTALFFPVGVTGEAETQIDAAKAVCRRCPVQDACLAFAVQTNQEYGVWGGTSEEERREIRRAWRRGRSLSWAS